MIAQKQQQMKTPDVVKAKIENVLSELGTGKVDPVVYDTAWVARLASRYPGYGFEKSLEWLRQHQNVDGTWGAPLIHNHDRFISTLAAIVTLREAGTNWRDERNIKRGELMLWQLVGRLRYDDSDTIGFPILCASLTEEARALGLDVPQPQLRYGDKYKDKVRVVLETTDRNWRASSLNFSLEALRSALDEDDKVYEENFSLSASPAATAGVLMRFKNENALKYLQSLDEKQDGGIPDVSPIDTFEIAWAINSLRRVGAITPDHPKVRAALDELWSKWSEVSGIGYSSYVTSHDVDTSSAAFLALKWGGYPVSADSFAFYERETYFCCFPMETNPSMSAQVRLLAALRTSEDHPQYEKWMKKSVNALRDFDENGTFYWDKWHASPYYVNSLALYALHGIADDLAQIRQKWIVRTQNSDGGWGYLGESTPEETAYCLEALLQWHRDVEAVDTSILHNAAKFLEARLLDQSYTPLWIGKSLYTPRIPVRASILAAMHLYLEMQDDL